MKKPPRAKTKAKQRELDQLQRLRALRQFLPQEDRSRPVLKITPRGNFSILSPLPDQDLSMLPQSARSVFALQARVMQSIAQQEGAKAIEDAEVLYREEFAHATHETLAGIEAGDVDPLCRHLALLGFALFEDGEIFTHVQRWWQEAREGKKDGAEKLAVVLKALAVGPGNLGVKTERQRQENANTRQRKYKARCQTALDTLRQNIASEIRNIPRSILRDSRRYQSERTRITERVIAHACQAADAPTRNAGKHAKALRARGIL